MGYKSGDNVWTRRFIGLAEFIAQASKDPSTKCGAVIVRPDKTVCSMGYNGFPRRMLDTKERLENREEKYSRVIHCEMNAILSAREPLHGYHLFTWPYLTCDRCAVHVIQTGIVAVYAPKIPEDKIERWGKSMEAAKSYYKEAGVSVWEI